MRYRLVALVEFVDETTDAIVSRELDCIFHWSSRTRAAQGENQRKRTIERVNIACGPVGSVGLRKRYWLRSLPMQFGRERSQ